MASTAREKSGAMASTRSSIVGRREYGGGTSRGCWQEAMSSLYQWGKGRRWGFEGRGLTSLSLDQHPFQPDSRGDVGGTPLPSPRRARFPPAPMCCLMMGNLSTLSGIGVDAGARSAGG